MRWGENFNIFHMGLDLTCPHLGFGNGAVGLVSIGWGDF